MDDQTALVRAAASGDGVAFERLVALHHEDLRRVCSLVTGNDSVADDAVQAAWAIAWRKMGAVRDPGRFRAWMASVAINEARRQIKRGGRRNVVEIQPNESADIGFGSGGDPQSAVSSIDLRNALSRLSPDDRALLGLRYVAGFDSGEIAAATGRTASGVRSRLARLLDQLEKELGDD
jgi:RNA polymerase sigma-70 factor (ECF subfamily)